MRFADTFFRAMRRSVGDMDTPLNAHMLDWEHYRKQVIAGVGSFSTVSPDTVKGYAIQSNAGKTTNHLDPKVRELIAIAVPERWLRIIDPEL